MMELVHYPADTLMYVDSNIVYSMRDFYAINVWRENADESHRGILLMYDNVPINIRHSRSLHVGVGYILYKPSDTIRTIIQPLCRDRNHLDVQIISIYENGYTLCKQWEPSCIIVRVADVMYYENLTRIIDQVYTYTIFTSHTSTHNDITIIAR